MSSGIMYVAADEVVVLKADLNAARARVAALEADVQRLETALKAADDESSYHVSASMLAWQRRAEQAEARVAALESMLRRCVAAFERCASNPALLAAEPHRRVLADARALLDDTQPTREGTR
jgi:hypothetical protein